MKNAGCLEIFLVASLTALVVSSASAQTEPTKSTMYFGGGYSRHGSGDYNGIIFGAGWKRRVSKTFSFDFNFRGTINNGKDAIYVQNTTTGEYTDASVRFTVAGVQAGVDGELCVFGGETQSFSLALGPFLRYQSASNGDDGYRLYGPTQTGVPTYLVGYSNQTPQKTYSLGGVFRLQYSVRLAKRTVLGISPGIQTDTNGDLVLHGIMTLGNIF